jgi:hypothetical protein
MLLFNCKEILIEKLKSAHFSYIESSRFNASKKHPLCDNLLEAQICEYASAYGVVGGEPASHHVDPGSIPGFGVVICDLVDALCIALPLRVCAVSLKYMIDNQMGEGKYANKTIGTWPYNLA